MILSCTTRSVDKDFSRVNVTEPIFNSSQSSYQSMSRQLGTGDEAQVPMVTDGTDEMSDDEHPDSSSIYGNRRFVSHIGPEALKLRRLVDESQVRESSYVSTLLERI